MGVPFLEIRRFPRKRWDWTEDRSLEKFEDFGL